MKDIIHISQELDLSYSPDDNGWYFQDYHNWQTSCIYDSLDEAYHALDTNQIIWEDK